jgi:hypothetical protein
MLASAAHSASFLTKEAGTNVTFYVDVKQGSCKRPLLHLVQEITSEIQSKACRNAKQQQCQCYAIADPDGYHKMIGVSKEDFLSAHLKLLVE